MKYIILAIVILAISVIIYTQHNNIKEGLTLNEQKSYLKKQDKYFDNRLFPPVVKGGSDDVKFVELSRDKTKLNKVKPGAHIDKSSIAQKIEKCKIIDKTGDCSEITANDCGYCWTTDKILYGDAKGPTADVCPKKGWVKPGRWAAYFCQKKKEQAICNEMKDCGDVGGKKSICGWCPSKAKGVPKKVTRDGRGFEAKYSEDKCNWKSKAMPTAKWLGWTPSKGGYPNRNPSKGGEALTVGEGDCDRDEDCGPGLKCGHDGRMTGVKDPRTGKNIKPNARGRDYCYDPNFKSFQGSLIKPSDCAKFKQMFPCVGPNMLTGPHSDACLSDLWKKSGCSGNIHQRVTDRKDYNWWNSNSFTNAGNNMKSFSVTARRDTNYDKAKAAYKKCYGKEVNPCEERFKPRPLVCSRKLYAETGCSSKGQLHPDKQKGWPNGYVGQQWLNGQKGSWSNRMYQGAVNGYKRQAYSGQRNPKANFDKAIYTNMLCFGKAPKIPWDKPCWKDFIIMMTATEYIKYKNGELDFSGNSGGGFKAILPRNNYKAGWKKGMAWKGNYILTKNVYEKPLFPFWNFIKTNKSVWNGRWSDFKRKMMEVPSVEGGTGLSSSKWFGWNHERNARGRIKAGEGDCDRDSDCAPGLKCGQNKTKLPGVYNTGAMRGGRDFCYDPNSMSGVDHLKFLNGSPFDSTLRASRSLNYANSKGMFYQKGNDKILTKNAYLHEHFPYWQFLRIAARG